MTTRADSLVRDDAAAASGRIVAAAVEGGAAVRDRDLVHLAYLWRHTGAHHH